MNHVLAIASVVVLVGIPPILLRDLMIPRPRGKFKELTQPNLRKLRIDSRPKRTKRGYRKLLRKKQLVDDRESFSIPEKEPTTRIQAPDGCPDCYRYKEKNQCLQ